MLPSIFNDNLFDDFFNFPFYDDKAERRAEKKLYGHHAHNLMKTDIKEKKDGYELEMDLPGFKKDESPLLLSAPTLELLHTAVQITLPDKGCTWQPETFLLPVFYHSS